MSNGRTSCIRHQVIGQGNPNNDRKPPSRAPSPPDRRHYPHLLSSRVSCVLSRENVNSLLALTDIGSGSNVGNRDRRCFTFTVVEAASFRVPGHLARHPKPSPSREGHWRPESRGGHSNAHFILPLALFFLAWSYSCCFNHLPWQPLDCLDTVREEKRDGKWNGSVSKSASMHTA